MKTWLISVNCCVLSYVFYAASEKRLILRWCTSATEFQRWGVEDGSYDAVLQSYLASSVPSFALPGLSARSRVVKKRNFKIDGNNYDTAGIGCMLSDHPREKRILS